LPALSAAWKPRLQKALSVIRRDGQQIKQRGAKR